jgi:hypothetical protein
MKRNTFALAVCSAVLLATVLGCEAQKSSNPLSPSVAGPIAGVEITAPRMVEPAQGARFKEAQQPIRLLVENATSSGVRPLYYTFEVATDAEFQTKMFARSQVTPGGDGRTTVQIDRLELGRTYHWRARAEDGANSGPYVTAQFQVLPRASIGAPAQIAPINNERTGTRQPTMFAGRPDRNEAVGGLVYEFQIATDGAFSQIAASALADETGGQTTFTPGHALAANTQHFWRVRAADAETQGPWSATQGFITPGAAPPPGPGPGPAPAPGAPCISGSPEAVVACERAKFGFMSHDQMAVFIRNVARSLNASRIPGGPWGILRKDSGANCGGYSCDIICAGQGGGQRQYDVLSDIDSEQGPKWSGPLPTIRVDVCEIQ